MLRTLLRNLGLDRYTPHGLRATGPTELRLAGQTKEDLRRLLVHSSITTREVCLEGAADLPAIARLQDALAVISAPTLESAPIGPNRTKAAEATGRRGRQTALPTASSCTAKPRKMSNLTMVTRAGIEPAFQL